MKGSTPRKRAATLRKELCLLYDEFGGESNIVDMLTDLRHLCDLTKFDFAELNGQAYRHYSEEKWAKAVK